MEETDPTLTETVACDSGFPCFILSFQNVIIPMVPAAIADATLVFLPAG